MLFRRRSVGVATVDPSQVPESKRPDRVNLGGPPLAEYSAIAEGVGFDNGALLGAQVQDFLAEQEIPVWDTCRVIAFLTAKAEADPARKWLDRWCWKPLRKCDIGKLTNHVPKRKHGHISEKQYHGAVPLSAMKVVEKIYRRFGDKVCFYVSDYASNNPAPFLVILGIGMETFVVAHWDEPSFKG